MKLRSLDLDLINAHFGTDATDIWPIAHALKIPMLVTLHGYDINTSSTFWESGKGGPHRIKYPKMLLHMASDPRVGFIAVSEAIKRSAIAFGIPPEKIIVSHIGVDTEYFKPGGRTLTERKPRILFVGRFVEQKGPLRMIRAFAEVAATIPDCELVMLGDGPLIGEARDLAHRLGLNVMFPGVLDRNQVVAQMHEARLLCFPSSGEEGLGMVLLEAQACGLPVISTARGGALEAYIEGETGITCAESDIACLARNLVRCLVNDDLTLRMSANAIDFIRSRFKLAERSLILESLFLMHIQQEAINAEAAD
jgi:glycosyltransferase involved in cell wall biosynthesis